MQNLKAKHMHDYWGKYLKIGLCNIFFTTIKHNIDRTNPKFVFWFPSFIRNNECGNKII